MGPSPVPPMIGRSEAMGILRERLSILATAETPVLLVGEAGTGRSLAARTVHALSRRRGGPFVTLDCTAVLPPGAIEEAREGVLFLRHVERLADAAQRELLAGLLRAPEVRVISAGQSNVGAAEGRGALDPDLSRRIAADLVTVPPLRDRGGDMLPMARYFVETIRRMNALPPIQISPAALAAMERYLWPGNVTELRDAVERAMTVVAQGLLQPEHLPEIVRREAAMPMGGDAARSPRRFREAKRRVVDSFERSYLEDMLAWHRGNVTAAAAQAGMLRSALQRLLRKHDLRSSEFRKTGRGAAIRRELS